MKNKLLLALVLGAMNLSAEAANCPAIKSGIEAKLKAKGLHHYSLDVVSTGDEGNARIVGQCNGGKSVIVYSRGAGAARVASPAPAADSAAPPAAVPAAKPAKNAKPSAPPPALGNY